MRKVSIRDLPYVVARGEHGATTVASTMRLAALAGIRVFTTGGLGGVHRGAGATFDVSADLTELSVTPVTVVSAGVKSILDIGLTLEKLETLGVPVLGFGTDEFPAFYTRSSGYDVPLRVDSAEEIAAQMRAKDALGIGGGISVANPIPEADEIPRAEIDAIIEQALADLARLGITGKDITPYLLGRIVEITGGASLTANIALVRNNAHLGAAIATSRFGCGSPVCRPCVTWLARDAALPATAPTPQADQAPSAPPSGRRWSTSAGGWRAGTTRSGR